MHRSCVALLVFLALSVGSQARYYRPRYRHGTYVDARGYSQGHGDVEGSGTVTSDEDELRINQDISVSGEPGSRTKAKVRTYGRDDRGRVRADGAAKTRGEGFSEAFQDEVINDDGIISSASRSTGESEERRGSTRSRSRGSSVTEDKRADSRTSTRTRGNSFADSQSIGEDRFGPSANSFSGSAATGGRSSTRGSTRYRDSNVDARARSGSTSSGDADSVSTGAAFRPSPTTGPIGASRTVSGRARGGRSTARGTSTFMTRDGRLASSRGSLDVQGREATADSQGVADVDPDEVTSTGRSSAEATDSYAHGRNRVVSRTDRERAITRDASTVQGTGDGSTSGNAMSTDTGSSGTGEVSIRRDTDASTRGGRTTAHGTSAGETKGGKSSTSRGSSATQGREADASTSGDGFVSDLAVVAGGESSAEATDSYASGENEVVSRTDKKTAITKEKSSVKGTGESSTEGRAFSLPTGTTATGTVSVKTEGGEGYAEKTSAIREDEGY